MNLGTIALGNASIVFLSGHRTSDVVGHPATLLLEIDEAQGLNKDKFLTDFAPMVASTNATIVLYGTAWTPDTLLEIVRFYWWTGRKHRELFPQLVDLLKNVWHCQSVVVDATGIGATVASFLADALGPGVSHSFVFTAQSKSVLGYRFISAVNNGRLKLFGWTGSSGEGPSPGPAPPSHPGDLSRFQYPDPEVPEAGAIPNLSLREDADAVVEFLKQLRLLRSDFHANERLSFEVDPRDGHDDLVIATALAVEAAYQKLPGVAIGRLRYNPYD